MKRILLLSIAAATALALAGCSSTKTVTRTDGASKTAVGYLADIRLSHGLSRPAPDAQLERAALQQARYMAETSKMKHTTRFGRDFSARMRDNAIRGAAAENIAHGRMSLGEVFQRWENSPPHRRNMLDPRFEHFGLGSATDAEGKRYWALVLGR